MTMKLDFAGAAARLAQAVQPAHAAPAVPAAPRTLAETGLPEQFLLDLAGRLFFLRSQHPLKDLAQELRLPTLVAEEIVERMRAERLVEVVRRGSIPGDALYALTGSGRDRATES